VISGSLVDARGVNSSIPEKFIDISVYRNDRTASFYRQAEGSMSLNPPLHAAQWPKMLPIGHSCCGGSVTAEENALSTAYYLININCTISNLYQFHLDPARQSVVVRNEF
jgi:hypothetical protein